MSIEIVTGYQGRNHITSNDVGGFQQGVVGVEDYVLGVGEKAKATLISNNSVRISDGELVMQGVHWRIKPGTYENVTINNGSQGMRRKDAIIARYRKNSGTGVESIELAVLQGTPTYSTPTAPTPTTGNIRSGALRHEMILYVVELNGLNVVGVKPAFKAVMSMYEINKYLSESCVTFPDYTKVLGRYTDTSFTVPENCWARVEAKAGWSNASFNVNGNGVIIQQILNTNDYPIKTTVMVPLKKGDRVTMSTQSNTNSITAILLPMR